MRSTPASMSLLIIAALLCAAPVVIDAARKVPDSGDGRLQSQDTAAYATLHEGATTATVMAWTAQLPQGPSPRGPGH
ncbi:hypothetical protein ACQ4PT_036643 [Festuca glaucescens]